MEAYEIIRKAIVADLIENNVFIFAPDMVHIDSTAKISPSVKIFGECHIIGDTQVLEGTELSNGCYIENSYIAEDVKVISSRIIDSTVLSSATVGPFSFIRENANVGRGCRIGDFVEIKNSKLGDGTKCAHLAYVGDAEVGKSVNIGCGAVFANYDGVRKQRSLVGDKVFIGSNVNLIAPIEIGDNCYIASGSTVTTNLAENSFCVARNREYIKDNYRPDMG